MPACAPAIAARSRRASPRPRAPTPCRPAPRSFRRRARSMPWTAPGSAAAWSTAAASTRATWSKPAATRGPCWRSATIPASRWVPPPGFAWTTSSMTTQNAGEGRFLVSVLKGSVRALTGLIAKANNRNVGFSTATATIGIRGTGLDINCTGACAGEAGDSALGLTALHLAGRHRRDACRANRTAGAAGGAGPVHLAHRHPRRSSSQPEIDGPRPDTVTVPPKLFSSDDVSDDEEGLFVFVRDGHIEIATAAEVLHLGKGEAGFAGNNGETRRPTHIPKFIDFDRHAAAHRAQSAADQRAGRIRRAAQRAMQLANADVAPRTIAIRR